MATVIFVWGERGDFSDIPTSEILYVDNYDVMIMMERIE